MNPENPTDPREALEPSLTALILGELPDEQARFLRQAIATDPELAKTFERLKKTTALIRETETPPAAEPVTLSEAPRLSEAKRQELLQRFKTVQPEQFRTQVRRRNSWILAAAAAVAFLMMVTAVLLPSLSKNKSETLVQLKSLEGMGLPRRKQLVTSGGFDAPQEIAANSADSSTSSQQHSMKRLLRRGETLAPSGGINSGGITSGDSASLARASGVPAQADKFSLRYGLPPTEPAATPNAPLAAPAQQTIILPFGDKQELAALYSENSMRQTLTWGFDAQSQTSAGALVVPGLNPPLFASGLSGGGGIGGGAAGQAQQPVPVLGDAPQLGRLILSPGNDVNASSVAQQNESESVRFLKEGKPALQSELKDGDEVYRSYFLVPHQPLKSESTPGAPLAGREKQTADSFAYELNEKLKGVPSSQPAMPGLQTEGQSQSKLSTFEVDQKAALAEKRDEKETSNTPNILIAKSLDDRLEELKKQTSDRSKASKQVADAEGRIDQLDLGVKKPVTQSAIPQPEIQTKDNVFSTFSLNVSDVSFKLAAASLEQGKLPDPSTIRSEEFINAFDYRDPEPAAGQPIAFACDRARYPFAQNRDLLRFSIKTAAAGRQAGRPLNIVLLLDNSGSMERADRVQIIHDALRVLATQLGSGDTLSVVTFARTARLWIDGVPGDQAGRIADELSGLTPQGGTNLEEAMNLAYQTALRHYLANGINRVVLLTDGAANLGDTDPQVLKQKVESNRKQGIALDCFGIGWEGYNDDLLEVLTRNGDGRYGFLNTPEEAATQFAVQLAGALHVAAADVKVQVEFNPNRVISYRQIGYARHQLTKEQFRDNTVDAAEIGAAESGNALYVVETNPQGDGPIATVRVRYKVPGTSDYQEHEWAVPFAGNATSLEQASPAMRLAGTASAFSEWLASSPYAAEVTPDRLIPYLNGIPAVYGADPRPQKLEWMIRQAKALIGR